MLGVLSLKLEQEVKAGASGGDIFGKMKRGRYRFGHLRGMQDGI